MLVPAKKTRRRSADFKKEGLNAKGGNDFKPTIETVAQRYLYGNWMTLGVETLDQDYDLVWAVLAARIRPIADQVRDRVGLGTEVRLGRPFPYWTAVELDPGAPVPAGMVPVMVPAGKYLALGRDSTDDLAEAYDFVYNHWENSQDEFIVDHSRPCFEQYGPATPSRKEVTLFMPLASREARPGAECESRADQAETG